MERRRSCAVASVAISAVLMAAACSGSPSDQPGQSQTPIAPITLRIGTDDKPDRPATDQITYFAERVNELSHGQLVVEPVWGAAGDGQIENWDQAVARRVVAGDLDMGLIPARAWDTEGVTSLRALQAPFLLTSNDLVGQVVRADMANEMLAGLDKDGVVGLALVPESLRQIFSFGKPFLSLGDFKGTTVRAPTSDMSSKVFKALGATVDDFAGPGENFDEAIADGTVDAAESEFALASFAKPATGTANVVPYPKVNALVVNQTKFAQLSSGQQDMLRQAAIKSRDWGVSGMPDPADGAVRYCKEGGTVVNTTAKNLSDMQTATQPVYAELDKDPQTKSFIDQIRALKSHSDAPTRVTPCKP